MENLNFNDFDVFITNFNQEGRNELNYLWNRFSSLRGGKCGEHACEVARISLLIGGDLLMSFQELSNLFMSALFHDVGKLVISEDVLSKPGMLNEDEYEHIQTHVQASKFILAQIPESVSCGISGNVLSHHEAVDGRGYPFGLCGSQIPVMAKIVAVADVYDAISSNRSYNEGGSSDMALWELKEKRGKKFEPRIVDCFYSLLDRGMI